ncbi:MAG: lamin tail domain-containing protein [Gracilimonas sp.]
MKVLFLLIAVLFPIWALGQTVNFEDDFEDEDISDWTGDNADFTFLTENGNTLLKQDAAEAGTSYLSIPSTDVEGYWEFFVRMEFSPSNNNRAFIYLMSDNSDLTGTLNGYMLQAGESLSDDVFRLFKITNGAKDGEILTGTTNISEGGDYRVKVTRDASGNWGLEVAEGYAGTLNLEDSGNNNDYTSATHFGFLTNYTVGNIDHFAFDFKIDIPPIEVSSISTVNDMEVDVTFTRDIDFGTVQTSDFTLNPGNITPASFAQQSTDVARITFTNPISSGENELTITDIDDAAGETTLADTTFSFIIFDEYQSGDIIINEFLKDPPTGTTEEYIELKNTSDKYLNLKNWQVGDADNLYNISNEDIAIFPDSFIVASRDTSSLRSTFGNGNYIELPFLSFLLNNDGDQIRLFDNNNMIADSLEYTSNWGGDDVALERRDASVSAIYRENWGDSPAENFGTPGRTNLIQPDETPPELVTIERTTADQIKLTFSERLQENAAENVSNFTLSADNVSDLPGLQSADFSAPDTIFLQFDTDLPSEPEGTTYELSISNQADIFGNAASQIIESFFVIEYETADSGDVFITEFMTAPPSGFTDFIELYNPTENAYNLQGWTYNDNLGNPREISVNEFPLVPNSRVILAPDSTMFELFPGITLIAMGSSRFANLNSTTPDDIVIRNQNGALIDSLTYTSSWGGDGVSLERRSISHSAAFQENWGDSPSENLATPGLPNEIQPDQIPPELETLTVIGSNQIQVIFSERVQSEPAENINNYTLSTVSSEITPPNIQSASYIVPDTLVLTYDTSLPKETNGTTYELTLSNQVDIFGNAADLNAEFFLIDYAVPDSGEVFITEFMYDPPELFAEFIELYNTTDSTFNLRGWIFNDNTGNQRVISDSDYPLGPNEYVILTSDSTIFNNFPGTPFISMGSRFSALNNNTDAIVIRDQNGELLDSLAYFSSWGGDEISLERRSIDFPANFRENWGNSPSEDLATPGLPNLIEADETPPDVIALSVLNDSTLQLIFSEQIQRAPAEDISNFELSENSELFTIPLLSSVLFSAPDTVILEYSGSLPRQEEGTLYQLAILNQADIFGNTAERIDREFFMIDISMAQPGDVVINEFMYDPGTGYSEFIELYNTTDNNFDLQNWTLNDNTGTKREITSQSYELSLGSYVVLAPDSSLIFLNPDVPIIVMGSRFPTLNNSTDAIAIRNREGILLDSLTYTSNWGGDEVSLERRRANISSFYRENWGDSPSENSATPGLANVIDQDNEPPQIADAFITAPDSIYLSFNERVDSVAATDLSKYSVTSSATLSEITGYVGNYLYLVLDSPLSDGEMFTVTVRNQQDIFGNILESTEVNLEFTLIFPEQPADVIVNEILYRRANANSEEFIELYNRTDRNFDLSNWTFSDATGTTTIPQGIQIRSGEYLILTDSESFGTTPGDVRSKLAKISSAKSQTEIENMVYLSGFPSLNDDEDAIVIKNREGNVIDSLYYRSTWGGDQPGVSLERKDPESPSNDASNWATSTAESGNSAGRQSSVFQPDETPPEIIFAKLQNDGNIFVAFSEFVQVDNTDILVNNETASVSEYNPVNGNIVIIGELEFPFGEPINVIFTNVRDFRGNANTNLAVEVSQPIIPGSVVINEILYDPLANSDDNLPDQTEYLELYNRSEYAISLEGFYLHDEPDENNEVRSIFPVTSQFKWIPPGSYVLIYAENQAENFRESQLARYFKMQDEDDRFFIRTNRANLSLANSDDAIYLADSAGVTIDSVFYDQAWQNPNLFDTKGVALERIDPAGPSNDEANWSSSTRVSGGTPGEQNSIFQQAGGGPDGTGITFTPNPFSPDADGFDDNLFINYKLDEPDYLLRVRIFDRYGRLVRELADGKQAGFEGSLIWDGLTDNRQRNRVGIYIVLFEAYNSANGKNRTFKKTVVLARKF